MGMTNKSPTILFSLFIPIVSYLSSLVGDHSSSPYFCSLSTIYQTNSINMDNNHADDYVLVLEDRTEVKNEAEVGELSVVSNIDAKGKLKTAPAEGANQ